MTTAAARALLTVLAAAALGVTPSWRLALRTLALHLGVSMCRHAPVLHG